MYINIEYIIHKSLGKKHNNSLEYKLVDSEKKFKLISNSNRITNDIKITY